jgi:hypothetical protein
MEIAGLVLTGLPFCLKGLSGIGDHCHKFMGYRKALGCLVRQLEVESLN